MIRITGEVCLWRVDGEECSESGGGDTTFFVATPRPSGVPDVHRAIDELTRGKYHLYNVTHVEQVGYLSPHEGCHAVPSTGDVHPAIWQEHEFHDQTGYDLNAHGLDLLRTSRAVEFARKAYPSRGGP